LLSIVDAVAVRRAAQIAARWRRRCCQLHAWSTTSRSGASACG